MYFQTRIQRSFFLANLKRSWPIKWFSLSSLFYKLCMFLQYLIRVDSITFQKIFSVWIIARMLNIRHVYTITKFLPNYCFLTRKVSFKKKKKKFSFPFNYFYLTWNTKYRWSIISNVTISLETKKKEKKNEIILIIS